MQEHVLELDENNKATAEGIPAAGAWVPNEQGFYRYVTQPARPVLASNTDEENVRYNVPIPFSVPRFAPQAVGNSFWLVARQGFRHMSNHFSAESWSQVSFPSVSLPKINLPQLPQININFPKIRFNTVKVVKKQGTLIGGWSHKSVKPDYNSTIQRMKRVQADLKHSWQNFDPVIANTTTPLTRRPIKNQWDLPPVKKSQKTSEPCPPPQVQQQQPELETDMATQNNAKTETIRNASKPARPVLNDGLDDIFPMPITGFFMDDRDAIPTVDAKQPENLPARIFEGELVSEENAEESLAEENLIEEVQPEAMPAEDAEFIVEVIAETFQSLTTTVALKLPALIEPDYYLPEIAKDVHETELATQLMLRNNKILSNSISALAHRYFKNNNGQTSAAASFLY